MRITPAQAAAKIRLQADRAFRLLILEAGKRIVDKTPVDTGRARGNWQVSVGAPRPQEYDEDEDGTRTILGIKHDSAGVDIDDVVWIVNGVDYVYWLEVGTPKIPPFAMVAMSLEELKAKTAEVAAVIRRAQ